MVSRDRRDPIVLQIVRKQGIKFCHDSPKGKETRNKILARAETNTIYSLNGKASEYPNSLNQLHILLLKWLIFASNMLM